MKKFLIIILISCNVYFSLAQECTINPKIIPTKVQPQFHGSSFTTLRAENLKQETFTMCLYSKGTTAGGLTIHNQLISFLGAQPNINLFTFSLKTNFANRGYIRYRYVIYKVPFINQADLSLWQILNTRNRIQVYNSGLITYGEIANAGIDREVTIPVENNYVYYSEFRYQFRRARIWNLSKTLKSNSFNIYENCIPKINYSFNNIYVSTGLTISKNLSENFIIKLDKDNSNSCSGPYFISIEESDQWMGRKPETQVGKWINETSLIGINNLPQSSFDLKNFYFNNFNKIFESGKYYRIEVAVGAPFTTKIFLLKVN